MTPKKLSAERLTKIRRAIRQLTAWTTPEGGYESAAVDLLAHCDALAAENQALREVAKFYRVGHDGGEIARAALEKTS